MLRLAFLLLAALTVSAPVTAKPIAKDWSRVAQATPSGGFVMGNPAAKVKLVEYGSLTCPHCAHFDAEGGPPLIADYVRHGRVSWEVRSFLLNGLDIPATLAANCAGPARFFPMLRALYAGQRDWVGKVQAIPADRMTAIQAMSRPQQFRAIGEVAGFPALAAAQGVPAARVEACLSNDLQATRALKVTADATAHLKVNSTPTFFVNGAMVDYSAGPSAWSVIKARLDAALKG